jgi:hypothetical protein
MAGEWHGHGMLCVNRPLQYRLFSLFTFFTNEQSYVNRRNARKKQDPCNSGITKEPSEKNFTFTGLLHEYVKVAKELSPYQRRLPLTGLAVTLRDDNCFLLNHGTPRLTREVSLAHSYFVIVSAR